MYVPLFTRTSIHRISLHVGKTEHGNTFVDSHPAFSETFLRPFTNFVRKVYRESYITSISIGDLPPSFVAAEVRERRALSEMPSKVTDASDTQNSKARNVPMQEDDVSDAPSTPDCGDADHPPQLPDLDSLYKIAPEDDVIIGPSTPESDVFTQGSSVNGSGDAKPAAITTIPMPVIAQSTPAIEFTSVAAPPITTGTTLQAVSAIPVPPVVEPARTADVILVALKSQAPSWIVEGYEHITERHLGPEFNLCINKWVMFEEVHQYESSERKVSSVYPRIDAHSSGPLGTPC
jgi:hypothetical protein